MLDDAWNVRLETVIAVPKSIRYFRALVFRSFRLVYLINLSQMASGMYQLPLYFPAGTNATPAPPMYQLPRCHDKEDSFAGLLNLESSWRLSSSIWSSEWILRLSHESWLYHWGVWSSSLWNWTRIWHLPKRLLSRLRTMQPSYHRLTRNRRRSLLANRQSL